MSYDTVDEPLFIQHKSRCIDCESHTSEKVLDSGVVYECDECGVRVDVDDNVVYQ